MEFYMPSRLVTGGGCVQKNASGLAALGRRCLIVTSGSGARRSGALKDVEDTLEQQGIAGSISVSDPGIPHDDETEYILTWKK